MCSIKGIFYDGLCSFSDSITEDGITLVFCGELYNKPENDSLIKLYLHYGFDFLQRLRGIYAFVLWDSQKRILICARDPLGVKSFLYSITPQGFVFASELKSLLASGLVSREVDRQSLRCLLERGSVSQPASILKDVHWLLPGHILILREGSTPEIRCFAPLQTNKVDTTGMNWEDIAAEGKSRIITALERRIIANDLPGAFLSGGIDSSLLVALMIERYGNVRTFSVGFESGLNTASEDETNDACEVALHLGVEHNTVIVRQAEIADNLRAVASGLDHPTVDGVNSWFAAKAVSGELNAVISGTGGDELFAGYPWFVAMQQWASPSKWQRFKHCLKRETFLSVFNKQYRIFSSVDAIALCHDTRVPNVRPDPLSKAESLNRVTGLLLQGYARDQLLADIDAAAMYHGLVFRFPLLDEDLLDFALSLPPEAKIGSVDNEALSGSYAATGVKRLLMAIGEPLLPEGFSHRAKRGFTLPFDGWLRGVLADQMNDLLSESIVKKRGFFEPTVVNVIKRRFIEGKTHWTQPWLLMMTELWAQEVLDV